MSELQQLLATEEFRKLTLKSLKSLENRVPEANDSTLFLIINTNKPLLTKRDNIQRTVPIPHKFSSFEEKRILLITQNTSRLNNYVELLRPITSKYDNVELITLKKLKSYSDKKLKNASKEYDFILCDYRIQKLLPSVLGAQFYLKTKKVPHIIKLTSMSIFDEKLKKDEVDIKFIIQQMKSICTNTSFLLSVDNNITIKLYDYQTKQPLKLKQLFENIVQVIQYLTDPKNKAITGWKDEKYHITSLYIKTDTSISLPIFKKKIALDER